MNLGRREHLKQIAACALTWNASSVLSSTRTFASDLVSDPKHQGFEAEFPSMGSKINLRWFSDHSSQEHVVAAATEIADFWVAVLSDYDPNSQAMRACDQADSGSWIPVSDELWSLIDQCDQWNRCSNGAFDAALGSLTRIRRQRKQLPPEQWTQARLKCGWKLLELDRSNHAIKFAVPGVRLDFGAIGKGFIVDRIADKLIAMGIDRFVVNASGNMRVGMAPKEKAGWPIAIEIPSSDASVAPIDFLQMRLSDKGIATSGDKWQKFPDAPSVATRDRTSHIVDPNTGIGLSGHQSVSVIAENAADADAAATATCVRARNELSDWLQTLSEFKPSVRTIVMLQDNSVDPIRVVSTL